jgi:phosphoglycerate dehydrogenase-like enzyme
VEQLSKPTVVVIGTGHVGKAVALLHWLGFRGGQDDREISHPRSGADADEYLAVPIAESNWMA